MGGGHGLLLSAILRQSPNSRGILFDAESVVEGAPAVLQPAGVSDRCTAVGDLFRVGARQAATLMCSSTSFTTGTTRNRCRSFAMCAPR
nr:methyltransferase [Mycolicibacterium stellerae]